MGTEIYSLEMQEKLYPNVSKLFCPHKAIVLFVQCYPLLSHKPLGPRLDHLTGVPMLQVTFSSQHAVLTGE